MNVSYYQNLATQVPPGELARAFGRRAASTARALLRGPRSWGDAELLRCFGATTDAELVARVLAPRASWADASQRASILQALARIPGARERALERARQARERHFDVFGVELTFGRGRPVDWSLDPVSGYRYPRVPSGKLAIAVEGRDPKYPWAMGRLDSLVALGQGYLVSEGAEAASFVEELMAQAKDFLQDNPRGYGIHWSCTMEVSLRAANLAQALLLVRDSATVRDAAWLKDVLRALAEHLDFVQSHWEDQGAVPNNHLIADHVGVLVTGLLFPELPGASEAVQGATEALPRLFAAQVLEDGVSFEGSVPYHRLVLELATLAQVTTRAQGLQLGAPFEARLRGMFRVARAYCSATGVAPQFGDNDSGRVVPLRTRASLDHGYLAPLGAALLGDAGLKGPVDTLPDEAAWLLGEAGAARFEATPATPPVSSFSSPQGGLHALRYGETVLTVRGGPAGQRGVGGHSHNDNLGFELHRGATALFVDTGTGTYTRMAELRHRFRSTQAHNTLEIDGQEQAPLDAGRPFALFDAAHTSVLPIVLERGAQRLTLRRDGYGSPSSPVVVERTFILDGEREALSIVDEILGGGSHLQKSWLHLRGCEPRLRPATHEELEQGRALPQAPERFAPLALELFAHGARQAVVLFAEGVEPGLVETLDSPGYGQVEPALAVTWGSARQLPARDGCWVLFERNKGNKSCE